MAMGDLRRRERPDFTRMRPLVVFHSHRYGPIPTEAWLTQVVTSKTIDGRPGQWSVVLRRDIATGERRDWPELVIDDDWVEIGVSLGSRQWIAMVGLVDSVSWSIQSTDRGGADIAYTIAGRDMTKPLVETQLLMMPHVSYDPALAFGIFYNAINALSQLAPDAGPGEVVRNLYDFVMRGGEYRNEARWWAVPDSLPVRVTGAPTRRRQFSDIVATDKIDLDTEGQFAAYGSLLSAPGGGGQLWDLLVSHSNAVLNELYIDLAPLGDADPVSALTSDPGRDFEVAPAIILRERPFPISTGLAQATSRRQRWSTLPRTTIGANDLAEMTLARGQERFNYFLVDAGSGMNQTSAVLAMAALAAQNGDVGTAALLEGVPAIDRAAVEVHGLRRLETTSNFINASPDGVDVYVGWTKLLRDWHCLAHEFWAGTVKTGKVLPGVRVGERLDLDLGDRVLQFYVESVTHALSVGQQGGVTSSTTIEVTRGHADPQRAVDAYLSRFTGVGQSTLGRVPASEQVLRTIREAVAPITAPLPGFIPAEK
ncbi:MAG: hypothetical protein EKK55_18355 [Rhodocyclaceae bacterium]|nr:MAG: hypothetical protein EKK55_18355 [Rhodocyclaceae bacterium]